VRAAVDRVLDERTRQAAGGAPGLSFAAAVLLHGAALAAILLLPRLAPPPKPLEFVPVQIVPAAALGVRRPAAEAPPQPPQKKPAETPRQEEPPPPPPKKDDVPVLPTEKAPKPATKPEPAKKPAPAPAPAAALVPAPAPARPAAPTPPPQPGEEAGRRGSPSGSALGTTAYGSQIAGFDNPDFTYGYYIDQLLAAIDANWVRPPVGDKVRAIVTFRIQRDGSITDLKIAEPSGYNAFDLAALRAVQNAVPLPPLPRAYRRDSLGVNLIVH
jgi:protein TonB